MPRQNLLNFGGRNCVSTLTWLLPFSFVAEPNNEPVKVVAEPIPEPNNEPVKVVVADSIQEIVLKSGKNVLLEFYASCCGHCKKLAPILDEPVSYEKDSDIVIAKFDATANDVPSDFDVKYYPTLYFKTTSGKILPFDEDERLTMCELA